MQGKYLDSEEARRILTIRNPLKGSAIWNFMLSCKETIVKHISWRIGNAREAKFWEDSWNGHKILDEEEDNIDLKTYFKRKWGNHVAEYLI